MQNFHESRSKQDPIEATDHKTSRLTTTSLLDYIKETNKPIAMTSSWNFFNPTGPNLPISLQKILDVDHNCGCCNTTLKNAID